MLLDVKFNNTLKCKFTSRCEEESFINAKKFGPDIDKIYTFTVKYDGNEYYNEAEDSATVTVKQMQTPEPTPTPEPSPEPTPAATERQNDDYLYKELASQSDFDRF